MRTLSAVRLLTKLVVGVALVGVGALLLSFRSDPGPGRPDVPVPWLIGAKLGDAAADLQDLGLCVNVEPGDGRATLGSLIEQHPRRYIVGQLPGAGASVPERTLVILRIQTEHETSRVLYQVAQTNRAMTCPAGSGVGDANA
jgi:beta-lactam-binding protein with PASTA domain